MRAQPARASSTHLALSGSPIPTLSSQRRALEVPFPEEPVFEDSTFASASRIHTRSPRYAAGSLILQTAFAAVLILLPYVYPNALPRKLLSVALIAPPPPRVVPVVEPQHAIASSTRSEFIDNTFQAPPRIPTGIHPVIDNGPPGPIPFSVAGANSALTSGPLGPATSAPTQRVHPPKPAGPLHVSEGVAAGLLMVPIKPRYPAIAQQAHIQGTVVISAIIGTDGRIASLRVLSGPPMLVQAAVDAIRQARYRPWTLNSQPVEVETTINVVFTLGSN